MGWLSDKLFGKRKRLDSNKLNSYMEDYTKLIDKQQGISEDLMNPDSLLSINRQNLLKKSAYDMMGQQNQNLQSNANMTNMSQGQMMAQQRNQNNQMQGQLGNQLEQSNLNSYSQGLGLLGQVTGMRRGEGERQSNSYMQQINAHNQRRQGRMQMGMDAIGMGLNAWSGLK